MAFGQEAEASKVQLSTKCHASFWHICVSPLHYNESHNWNITKKHLLGIWKDNDITYDMVHLQVQIFAMSKAHVESAGIEDLALSINLSLWSKSC